MWVLAQVVKCDRANYGVMAHGDASAAGGRLIFSDDNYKCLGIKIWAKKKLSQNKWMKLAYGPKSTNTIPRYINYHAKLKNAQLQNY